MSWRQILIVVAILSACIGYLVYSATASGATYYRTVAEVRADPSLTQRDVRVLGVVQGGIQRTDGGVTIRFLAAQDGATMPVVYHGQVPDIFRPGIQVVVEGRLTDGVFQARTLLAKCPSRFTAATPGT